MIPVALISLLVLAIGFYEGRKAYWDSKVREMCAKDGGVQIINKLRVSTEEILALVAKGTGVEFFSQKMPALT